MKLLQLQNLDIVPITYLEIVLDSILDSSHSALVHNKASQGLSYKAFKHRCSDLWESSFCYYTVRKIVLKLFLYLYLELFC